MKNTKRFIAGVITLTMVSAMAPINAFATENIKTIDANTSSNSTDVKYSVDPSYTVVIPASITLSDTAATSASISVDETAKPFKLAKGQKLSVKIANEDTNDFKVTNADDSLDYTVTAGSETLAKGSTAAEFSNDDKTDKTLTFSKMDSTLAKYAGDYTGTLTFDIAVEDPPTAPKYADKVKECEKNGNGNWKISSFYDGTNLNITIITKEEAMALAEYLGGGDICVVYEPNGTAYAREVDAAGNVSGITLSLTNTYGVPLYYVPADNS
ncbi:hypothetical protein [Ruminococcus albus]|uniref:Uncharacterized protein n=1 Tax=Ruminococcus albus TaxID=1264 RepID=A0A1I1R556_RUMAL|nr:hypothetical protein [Ruminococcus albus]SFD29524.1 hypothetical protein SAMN02910406_03600 [Ruminococcus albus]